MNTVLLFGNILAYSLQIAFLTALAGFAPAALRLTAPRARLLYWHFLLVASLLLPAVQPWQHRAVAGSVQIVTGAVTVVSHRVPRHTLSWTEIALVVLATGILIHLGKLALGFRRLRRYRRHSRPFEMPEIWSRKADFRISEEVSSPVTFGFRKPVILLPTSWAALDEPLREAIVWHELMHVRRRDWLFTIAEEFVRAIFWFHPAIWWVLGEIQLAREQAVDQAVVEITNGREEYVDALLAIAGSPPRLDIAPAPLFLRRRHLKQRVVSILKEVRMSRTKMISTLSAGVAVLAASCWVASGVFPLEGAPQTPPLTSKDAAGVTVETNGAEMLHRSGVAYPPEAIAKGIQGTVVVQAKLDSDGTVLDASVISGPDELRKSALQSVLGWHFAQDAGAGTRLVTVTFDLPKAQPSANAVNRLAVARPDGTPLAISVQKMQPRPVSGIAITGLSDEARSDLLSRLPVHEGDTLTPELLAQVNAVAQAFDLHLRVTEMFDVYAETVRLLISPETAASGLVPPPPPQSPASPLPAVAGRLRIGADVQQANLLSQVKPVYPPLAKAAHVQGSVIFNAVIGKDGHIEELQLVSGPPLLVQAAKDAVQQWVYKPTLLNGDPTEVQTTITVNFTLAE